MKPKMTIFIVTLFLSVWSINSNAQTTIPKGKAQLIEFTNATSMFTVPEGKTWIIYNIFSDYIGDVKTNQFGRLNAPCIRIFLKSINNVVKTDLTKQKFGTQLYRSTDATKTIGMPIVFPEKTNFELILVSGDALEDFKLYNKSGYISIIETEN